MCPSARRDRGCIRSETLSATASLDRGLKANTLDAGANTRQHHYQLTAYADKRGRLLAIDAEITVDVGAYSVSNGLFTRVWKAAQAGGNLPAVRVRRLLYAKRIR